MIEASGDFTLYSLSSRPIRASNAAASPGCISPFKVDRPVWRRHEYVRAQSRNWQDSCQHDHREVHEIGDDHVMIKDENVLMPATLT